MPAAESNPETAETTPEEEPKLSPLEAVRQAQANRVPPPGTGRDGVGRGKGRGVNPSAPRHYNRHK
jgi:hypothetical protein